MKRLLSVVLVCCMAMGMATITNALPVTGGVYIDTVYVRTNDGEMAFNRYRSEHGELYAVFEECDRTIVHLEIPEKVQETVVTEIDDIFLGYKELLSLSVPSTVTHIGGIFTSAHNLEKIIVDENNPTYSDDGVGVLYDKDKKTLILYPEGKKDKDYAIPNGVIKIGDCAFGGNSGGNQNLSTVEIPRSVTEIGRKAFMRCANLQSVYFAGSKDEWESIEVGADNDELTNAMIYYNSTGPEDGTLEEDSVTQSGVRYFAHWDEENQVAYFGQDALWGSAVTAETDASFLADVNELVGSYVFVESKPRTDMLVGPDTLLSVKPVETKYGTVSDTGDFSLTVGGVLYDIPEEFGFAAANDQIILHLLGENVVGLEVLEELTGTLGSWDKESRKITIDPEGEEPLTTYTLSVLTDEESTLLLEEKSDQNTEVRFVKDKSGIVYQLQAVETEGADYFVIGSDSNLFKHSWESFGYANEEATELVEPGENSVGRIYQTSKAYYSKLTEGMSWLDRLNLKQNMDVDSWAGSCFGLSLSMAWANSGRADVSALGATEYSGLLPPVKNLDLRDYINYCHLLQYSKQFSQSEKLINPDTFGGLSGWEQTDWDSFWDAFSYDAQVAEEEQVPLILGFGYNAADGHAVVVCGYESTDDYHVFKLYDCNLGYSRGEYLYLYISKKEQRFYFSLKTDDEKYYATEQNWRYFKSWNKDAMEQADAEILKENDASKQSTVLYAMRRGGTETLTIEVGAMRPFRIDAGDGTYLLCDGQTYSGNMTVHDVDFIGEQEQNIHLTINAADELIVTEYNDDSQFLFKTKSQLLSAEAAHADAIVFKMGEGISFEGEHYTFEATLSEAGAERLTVVSGTSVENSSVTYGNDGLRIDSEGKYTGIQVETIYEEVSNIEKLTPNFSSAVIGGNGEVEILEYKQSAPLTVTQTGCTYGETLDNPTYDEPTGTTGAVITYNGTLAKGGSYSSSDKPTEAGTYTVTVKCETATHIYEGTSASFTIAPKNISGMAVTLSASAKEYNGGEQSVAVSSVGSLAASDYDVSGTSGTNVGNYTVTVTGKGNYTGTATAAWKITPKAITISGATATDRGYAKDDKSVVISGVTFSGATLTKDTDYTVTGVMDDTNAGIGKTVNVTVVLTNSNYALDNATTTTTVDIAKSSAQSLADIADSFKYSVTSGSKEIGTAGMPADAGTLEYIKGTESKTGSVTVSSWTVDANGKVTYTLAGGAENDTVTLPVTVKSTNYADSVVNVKLTLTGKDGQAALNITNGTTVVYGKTLNLTVTGGSGTGDVTYAVTNGTGEAAIDGDVLTATKAGEVTVTATKVGDDNYNAVSSAPVTITISKADPTGTPGYTKITTSGKTLGDAALTVGTITPADGTIVWDLGDAQTVSANTSYTWTYTPADTTNYNILTGAIKPYVRATGGGGGGSISYSITGEKTENGEIVISSKSASSGTTITLTVKANEGYELDVLEALSKNGSKIEISSKDGKYTFKMPASNVTVKATFKKIADAVCDKYTDLEATAWYLDGVHFCIENELMVGTSETTFAPDENLSRAMVVQMLHNYIGQPATDAENKFSDVKADMWSYNAIRWGADKGVVSGYGDGRFGPDDNVTLEQAVAILHNYAGQPTGTGNAAALGAHSDWASNALSWAEANGILKGMPHDALTATATRAQMAQMLMNYLKDKV